MRGGGNASLARIESIMSHDAASRAPTAVIAMVLLLAAWLFLAPAQLGGSARYAVVDGASMEPKLHRGDLVVVRDQGRVEVGDIVLYRNTQLGVRVLHRVIREEGGRLVLQGDANDFVDDAHPRREDVAGSLWFSIPRAGSALLWLREPVHAALLVFILTVFALTGGGAARSAAPKEVNRG